MGDVRVSTEDQTSDLRLDATATAGSPPQLSWEQALAWRLKRHHLADRATPSDLLAVVGDICGLHAQLLSSAALSLWARIDGLERGAVDEALWHDRTLVKLWAMRGTLHLLRSDELGLWLAALGTYTHYGNSYPEMDVLADAVGQALAVGPLTREELAIAVERLTNDPTFGEWVRFSWGSYLKATTFRGLLCFAPSTGNLIRFTAPERWIPGLVKSDSAEALLQVTRRFLGAYAPLTTIDLARWWAGAGPARGASMLAALGDEAVEISVEGQRAWVLAKDVEEITRTEPFDVARLLPAFDPWVIGASRTNSAFLDPRYKSRVYRNQGWISPVLLVNGRMAGVWRHVRKGRRVTVTIEPFDTLPAWAGTQVEVEAERLAGFLGCELELHEVRRA